NGFDQDGGDGGAAAKGGNVTLTNSDNITTKGAHSAGIVAQSLGGAAGASGNSYGALGDHAGSPSNGGDGGNVTISTNGSTIKTFGKNSYGVFGESIGGQSSNQGNVFDLFSASTGDNSAAGGNGGTVHITVGNTSKTYTYGDSSAAIFGLSV